MNTDQKWLDFYKSQKQHQPFHSEIWIHKVVLAKTTGQRWRAALSFTGWHILTLIFLNLYLPVTQTHQILSAPTEIQVTFLSTWRKNTKLVNAPARADLTVGYSTAAVWNKTQLSLQQKPPARQSIHLHTFNLAWQHTQVFYTFTQMLLTSELYLILV